MMCRCRACLLLMVLVAAVSVQASNMRLSPQSVKALKVAKRAAHQAMHDAFPAQSQAVSWHHLQKDMVALKQLQQLWLHQEQQQHLEQQQQQQQQQRRREEEKDQSGGWVSIASIQQAEPTAAAEVSLLTTAAEPASRTKTDAQKHKSTKHTQKSHKYTLHHTQQHHKGDAGSQHAGKLDQNVQAGLLTALPGADTPRATQTLEVKDTPSLINTQPTQNSVPTAPVGAPWPGDVSFWQGSSSSYSRQTDAHSTSSADPGSSSSSGGSSGSSSSSGQGGVVGAASIGSITQFTKVLKISYEGAADDAGSVPDPSLAAATLEWSLSASSPHFDNAPQAKADGAYGHWHLTVDQEIPLIPADIQQTYIGFKGNASYPEQIIMTGRLSSVMDTLPVTHTVSRPPSTRTATQGQVPNAFLANVLQQLTVAACEYSGPCNWQQPNMGPLLGKLKVNPPITAYHSIRDLTDRKWLPDGVVQFVCTLDAHQEALVDCSDSEESTAMIMRLPV